MLLGVRIRHVLNYRVYLRINDRVCFGKGLRQFHADIFEGQENIEQNTPCFTKKLDFPLGCGGFLALKSDLMRECFTC